MSHRIKVTVTGYYEVPEESAWKNYDRATTAAQVAAVDQAAYDNNHVGAAEVIEWCENEVEVKIEAASEGVTVVNPDGTDSGMRILPGSVPPPTGVDSAQTEAEPPTDAEHQATLPHEHLHGTGEGQHVHEGWEPSRVQARMKRDGFCAAEEHGGYCMSLATSCLRHPHDCGMPECTEPLTHTHPTL